MCDLLDELAAEIKRQAAVADQMGVMIANMTADLQKETFFSALFISNCRTAFARRVGSGKVGVAGGS